MFNFDGEIVATQLSAMQMGDLYLRIRDGRAAMTTADIQQKLIALHQQYEQLVARYNRLADRYKADIAERELAADAYAKAMAEKDHRIAALEKENETLRTNLLLTEDIVESQRAYLTDLQDRHQKNLP